MIKAEELKKGISRRAFNTGALAAAAVLAGCGGNGSDETIVTGPTDTTPSEPEVEVTRFYGSGGHNCGGRCISVAEAANGRILRFLTDESKYTSDGTYIDPESRNFPQTRACARCRSYKYRLYHQGRLQYPLKQTIKRGRLDGFVRISWEQALREIATKHKTILDEYGVDGIYSIYAWGAATGQFQGASGGPLGAGGAGGAGGAALRYMGGAQSSYFGSYSTHQYRYFGVAYTGMSENLNANIIANHTKNLVFWGENRLSTNNTVAYSYIRAIEDLKKRSPNSKVYFIGPEFVDGAVTLADEWFASKPYTDPALVAGMLYHMLDNTFNLADGTLKSNPWLDVDYLDTMVYGFFDSPAYGLTETSGVIGDTGTRDVPEVPAGRSYCSWILGNNTAAKKYSELGYNTNYTANQFASVVTAGDYKRWAPCSFDVNGVPVTAASAAASDYKTKQDFLKPKTPAWASAITGIPEQKIKDLAELFAKGGPVASTWSGGQQKQADGVINLFAVQALHIITKNVSTYGAGLAWNFAPSVTPDPKAVSVTVPRTFLGIGNAIKAEASCTAWHTAIKMAYANELKANGYRAKYIPNWSTARNGTITTGDGDVYWDDGGTKTFIKWDRNSDGTIKTYPDGSDVFFQWDGYPSAPKISGIRLMYNTGGNIFINQHENSNDSREMLEYLNLNDYEDPHSFCLVSFDNFMSPTPRWSDYVLPAATSWEQQDFITPSNGSSFYVPQVIAPPGEAKPTWDMARDLLKAYEKVDPAAAGAAADFMGGDIGNSIEKLAKAAYYNSSPTVLGPYYDPSNPLYLLPFSSYLELTSPPNNPATSLPYTLSEYYGNSTPRGGYYDPASPFFGKSWEEYVKNPCLSSKPDEYNEQVPGNVSVMNHYKTAVKTSPFINTATGDRISTNEITSTTGGYGNQFANTVGAPMASLRYQVYSRVFTWQYENRFSRWHGWLPAGLRGQRHLDFENDRFVLEIPLYYAYEDYFMEAYGNTPANLTGLNFLLTTTHDRYRSHSSLAENPMLRELTHRVPGRDARGEYKPANDYKDYSAGPEQAFAVNGGGEISLLNRTINPDGTVNPENKGIASYTEIWMNEADGRDMGLEDGDLVQVENPIGAVRCVARLTKRCTHGFVGLHQGCWYDPRPLPNSYNHDFVDVGGNCNTLMASQPSRVDHGNGQQSAMVKIIKVTDY
jgi:anaerobic selenocysteine-containing dehydrogenase